MNAKTNLLSLLVALNPLDLGWGWAVVVENDQLIPDLHIHGVVRRWSVVSKNMEVPIPYEVLAQKFQQS